MFTAIFGALLPRFLILVGWWNDQAGWKSVFGNEIWLIGGWLFLPWTTLVYALVERNGLSLLNWIFLLCAFLVDLGTWGIGVFAARRETSRYGIP